MTGFRPVASSSEGCCYVVEADDGAALLLDAGAAVQDIQIATGFKVSSLAGCLLSHGHGDHAKSIKKVLHYGVDCYASAETWEKVGPKHHRAKTVASKQVFHVGPFMVQAFDAVHDEPGTLGFMVGHGTDRGLYLTDSAYSKYRFDGLTHLWVECNHSTEIMRSHVYAGDLHADRYRRSAQTHMSLERLLEMLDANDLSKVREIHLLHLSDGNSDEVEFADAVRRKTGKPVYVAAKRRIA